jgi:hypothetical protein
MENYKEESFGDLNEILHYLLKLRLPDDKEKNNVFWSFRGQRNHEWHLSIKHHSVGTPTTDANDDTENDKYDKWFSQYKKRMLHSREHDYLSENGKNPWWWLFYAKHHYLQTRLLDWSSNPLVAIYFAVENIISHNSLYPLKDKEIGGAVWALKVSDKHFRAAEDLITKHKLYPSSGHTMDENEWFMINPEPVSQRIVLQSGKFTYHPGKGLKGIDEMERRKGEKPSDNEELIKIRIDPDYNDKIRKQLGIMNIHHASLFPSPTGIAHFVNSEWPDIASY